VTDQIQGDRGAVVSFAASTASVDAIQRAAYRFSDRLSCELIPGHDEYRCVLVPISDDQDIRALVADFRTEVLDQVLRERIRTETEPIRTMILAHAFSRTGVIEPPDLA
jgi:His-Xaa-Ser system protein HxsD